MKNYKPKQFTDGEKYLPVFLLPHRSLPRVKENG